MDHVMSPKVRVTGHSNFSRDLKLADGYLQARQAPLAFNRAPPLVVLASVGAGHGYSPSLHNNFISREKEHDNHSTTTTGPAPLRIEPNMIDYIIYELSLTFRSQPRSTEFQHEPHRARTPWLFPSRNLYFIQTASLLRRA